MASESQPHWDSDFQIQDSIFFRDICYIMDSQLLYIILEILGVLIFASEGLFVKDIELHPYINVMLP